MSASYVVVRNDSGVKSLSTNERDFVRTGALSTPSVIRMDGRRDDEIRKVRLHFERWDNGAECTVQWGVGTRVTSSCTADLVPPSPDRPNEGIVNFAVDLSPMAGTLYRQAPPVSTAPSTGSNSRGPNFGDKEQRLLTNRILRCIERIVLIGGALDTEALALLPGKWVWRFTISLTVLDDCGNIVDACVLAALAALRHYRKPHVDISGNHDEQGDAILPTIIPSTVKEATPLPLHHTPLSISYALVPSDDATSTSDVAALIDPSDREELVQAGNLTIAMNIHSEVCLLDYGGGCELPPSKLKECFKTTSVAVKELCRQLEETLEKADQQAQKEQVKLLQRRHTGGTENNNQIPELTESTPYLHTTEDNDEAMNVTAEVDTRELDTAKAEAEEAYRRQALDYSTGHVASAVREDEPARAKGSNGGALLASLLKAAKKESTTKVTDTVEMMDVDVKVESGATKDVAMSIEKKNSPPMPAKIPVQEKSTRTKKEALQSDSDNEETTTTILQTEFSSIPTKSSQKVESKASAVAEPTNGGETELEVMDLSMAVKKKKKTSKGKSKQK